MMISMRSEIFVSEVKFLIPDNMRLMKEDTTFEKNFGKEILVTGARPATMVLNNSHLRCRCDMLVDFRDMIMQLSSLQVPEFFFVNQPTFGISQ